MSRKKLKRKQISMKYMFAALIFVICSFAIVFLARINIQEAITRFNPKADSSQIAFPGAEGFGAKSVGGRGGRVIEVTTLAKADDGKPGSFRWAVSQDGPRTIVFKVGGTIEINSAVNKGIRIDKPYITIAGQTAPGGGIALKNGGLSIRTHDVIIRYLRVRPGSDVLLPDGEDAITIYGDATDPVKQAYNIIIDHCSLGWATDGNLDIGGVAHDITAQWNIVSEALHCTGLRQDGECHSRASDIGGPIHNVTFHHNLYANNSQRNPQVAYQGTGGIFQWLNNVVYNYHVPTYVYVTKAATMSMRFEAIANYYKNGPERPPNKPNLPLGYKPFLPTNNIGTVDFYSKDTISPYQPVLPDPAQYTAQQIRDLEYKNGIWVYDGTINLMNQPHVSPPGITLDSTQRAYDLVLDQAGATLPSRDVVDRRIVTEVRNGTGKIINSPNEVGGYPSLSSGTAAADTDHDGMPNDWETLYGFSTSVNDGAADADGDGYTNVEEYLNQTSPGRNATPVPTTPPVTPPPTIRPTSTPIASVRPSSSPTPARNVILNGTFNDGKMRWTYHNNVDTNANTTGWTVEPTGNRGNGARIRMLKMGTNVQFYQSNIILNPNRSYLLAFYAKSKTGHDMSVSLLKHVEPFTEYGLQSQLVGLTTSWKYFTIPFTTKNFASSVNDGRLRFTFNGYAVNGDEYWIDEVKLTER